MKRKALLVLIGVACLGISPIFVSAESDSIVEAVEDTEEDKITEEEVSDIVLSVDGTEFTIKNESGIVINDIVYEYGKVQEEGLSDVLTEETAAESAWNLVLTDHKGTTHIFIDFVPDKETWKDAVITEQLGIFYILYTDNTGTEQEVCENKDETVLEQDTVVYSFSGVNLRKEPSTDATVLRVLSLGEKLTATAVCPGWVKVRAGNEEGYVSHKYVTTDEEIIARKKEAQATATVSPSTGTYSDDSYSSGGSYNPGTQSSGSSGESSSDQSIKATNADSTPTVVPVDPVTPEAEPTVPSESTGNSESSGSAEVSRQNYDDCDGSGHGYTEIIYEDGTTEIVDY